MDAVYPAIEEAEAGLHADLEQAVGDSRTRKSAAEPLRVDADAERKPREPEEMVKEAEWLRTFFEVEKAPHQVQ